MKRLLIIFIVFILTIGILGGCEEKLPEGFENEEVYDNLVGLLNFIDKSIDEGYFEEELFFLEEKYIYPLSDVKNKTQKEEDALSISRELIVNFYMYNAVETLGVDEYETRLNYEQREAIEIVKLSRKLAKMLGLESEKYNFKD